MHVTSLFSAVFALLGTLVAFKYLPGRRPAEPVVAVPQAAVPQPQLVAE
jgi:hypothetical protein